MAHETWVIIDVGYYTTDFGLVTESLWAEQASQSAPGVASAADALRQTLAGAVDTDTSIRECAEILRTKSLRVNGKRIDVTQHVEASAKQFGTLVVERAERVFGDQIRKADGVMVVGGGAELAFDVIHKRWPHATMPKEPRFAVARGMQRAGAL